MLANILKGASSPSAVPSIEYITHQTVTNTSNILSVTGINIGSEDPTRLLVMGIQGFSGSPVTRTLNSVTVDGSSGTIIQSVAAAYAGGIVYIPKPTGTTANISATFSASMANATFFIYKLTNLSSNTPQDFNTSSGGAGVTLTTTNGGVGLAIVKAAAATTFTSGVTLDIAIDPDGRPQRAGSAVFSSASTSIDFSGSTTSRLYAASWI